MIAVEYDVNALSLLLDAPVRQQERCSLLTHARARARLEPIIAQLI